MVLGGEYEERKKFMTKTRDFSSTERKQSWVISSTTKQSGGGLLFGVLLSRVELAVPVFDEAKKRVGSSLRGRSKSAVARRRALEEQYGGEEEDPKLLAALQESQRREAPYAGVFLLKDSSTDSSSYSCTFETHENVLDKLKGKDLFSRFHQFGTLVEISSIKGKQVIFTGRRRLCITDMVSELNCDLEGSEKQNSESSSSLLPLADDDIIVISAIASSSQTLFVLICFSNH
ncbi:unnamed protein product [Eruca vesicaria subsp. sativa]|uniref:Uncharacterized protein n=1 Tax=Eruca vesicaria subsp. sativa TaxID=29727 RepID=A0ABC8KV34_ERUVS|nr:unnamed protein product [Eruca vesicaria subsp. sativa]